VPFPIITTTSVTRPCFTTQHQTYKTKTTVCKTKTDFLVSDWSCPGSQATSLVETQPSKTKAITLCQSNIGSAVPLPSEPDFKFRCHPYNKTSIASGRVFGQNCRKSPTSHAGTSEKIESLVAAASDMSTICSRQHVHKT